MKKKYTTSKLIIYLDRIEGSRDSFGDEDIIAHKPEIMEIKSRLLELEKIKENTKRQVRIRLM